MNSDGATQTQWARCVVTTLASAGVAHVCLCPGARSAPLAFAVYAHPTLTHTLHRDERAGAFWALGLARTTGRPVAVVCTSGSAVSNLHPAVVEANLAGVPLVLVTADRPPELHGCGAAQAMDQHRLFGSHVRGFLDPGAPVGSELALHAMSRAVGALVRRALSPDPGPVHLNVPLREPLDTDVDTVADWPQPAVRWAPQAPAALASIPEELRALLRDAQRPVVLVGPPLAVGQDLRAAVALAERLGAPLIADPLSGLRDDPSVISTADTVLRDPQLAAALAVDVVVRVGAMPTSRAIREWLVAHQTHVVLLDPYGRTWESVGLPTWVVPADAAALVAGLTATPAAEAPTTQTLAARRAFAGQLAAIEAGARATIEVGFNEPTPPVEGAAIHAVVAQLAPGDLLYVASSMPIRDLDAWVPTLPADVTVLANRGANGIDGTISTALGAAAGLLASPEGAAPPVVVRPASTSRPGRLWVVLGDLAALHDLTGPLAWLECPVPVTIVVVNNDGGGIFGFLGVGTHGAASERLFGTPHGRNFAAMATLMAWPYLVTTSVETLTDALEASRDVPANIVEYQCDRTTNIEAYRALARRVTQAARTVLP